VPVINIKNKELMALLELPIPEFPRYASLIINMANRMSQGTRPKVVGKLSGVDCLFEQSNARNLIEWENWYKKNRPDAIDQATARVWKMIQKFKDVIAKIDEQMVRIWVEDLVLAKTVVGLRFQKAILKKVAEHLKKDYRESTADEESRGIDGWIVNNPVSIKPTTYKLMDALPENIDILMIYYSKGKDGIKIEF
jgi:hypothetical protein